MSSPMTIKLNNGKPFPQYELPFPLEYTFTDWNGTAIPLTDFSVEAFIDGPDESTDYLQGGIAVTDAAAGKVTYTWEGTEFSDLGSYSMIIWVSDGTNRFGSDKIVWTVYDAPGTEPTI